MRRVLCPASPVPPEPSVPATTPPADRMPHHPLPGLRHNSAVSPGAVTKLLKDESDQVPLRTAPMWFGSALFLPSIAPRSHFAPPRPHTQAAPTHTVLGQESSVLVLSPLSGLHSRRRFRVKHPIPTLPSLPRLGLHLLRRLRVPLLLRHGSRRHGRLPALHRAPDPLLLHPHRHGGRVHPRSRHRPGRLVALPGAGRVQRQVPTDERRSRRHRVASLHRAAPHYLVPALLGRRARAGR
jgi:hypothetical protein